MNKFHINEYLSKELALTLLSLLLSSIIFFIFSIISSVSDFNDKIDESNLYVKELNKKCEICNFINSRKASKKEIQKVLSDNWLKLSSKDSLNPPTLHEMQFLLSNTKEKIVDEIAALRKFEDLRFDNKQDEMYISELKTFEIELELADKLEEHCIYFQVNGLNSNDLVLFKESKDLVLKLSNEFQSMVNKGEYQIQNRSIDKSKGDFISDDLNKLKWHIIFYSIGLSLSISIFIWILNLTIKYKTFKL